MPTQLDQEITTLRRMILGLGAVVEDNLRLSVQAIMDRDDAKALRAIQRDLEIDRDEVDVEQECLKTLALQQPVAHDLRFIVAILKINHDLERVGDLTVNIAERALALCRLPPVASPFDLPLLASLAQQMLTRGLDAMVNQDKDLAREVWFSDDEVDRIHREAYARISDAVVAQPGAIPALLSLLSVSRNLERIADHAASIAKDVVYMVEGEIVRHQGKRLKATMEAAAMP